MRRWPGRGRRVELGSLISTGALSALIIGGSAPAFRPPGDVAAATPSESKSANRSSSTIAAGSSSWRFSPPSTLWLACANRRMCRSCDDQYLRSDDPVRPRDRAGSGWSRGHRRRRGCSPATAPKPFSSQFPCCAATPAARLLVTGSWARPWSRPTIDEESRLSSSCLEIDTADIGAGGRRGVCDRRLARRHPPTARNDS